MYPIFFLSNSKIQKYSPTESAKIYDKAVNRKSTVHFNPRQTLDFISNNIAHATLTNDIKKRIVKQYLDVSRRVCPYAVRITSTQRMTSLDRLAVLNPKKPLFTNEKYC